MLDLTKLKGTTRVEVIDDEGRSYVSWDKKNNVKFSLQDGGKTLKIFITKHLQKSIPAETVMPRIMELIDEVIEIHPYKQIGNRDSYSQYNEGWEGGLDRLKTEIENNFSL